MSDNVFSCFKEVVEKHRPLKEKHLIQNEAAFMS